MKKTISRRQFLTWSAAFAAITAMGLSGCSGGSSKVFKIGTMPTEDILPMWVAASEDIFKEQGVNAEVVVFDSAQNLSAAITAGEVDIAMTDPMRSIKLCEAGTQVTMEWITLGTDASQGRFGVLAPADAPYSNLKELLDYSSQAGSSATKGVGAAANTVPEYVFDMLCQQEGIDPADIGYQEIPSLPDRFSMVASGKIDAAALPGSMLALGEATGMKLLADDSKGDNVSQSVMIATAAMKKDNADGLSKLRAAWDAACEKINANPESYRALLIENANLNEAVADSYPIPTYPAAVYPPANLIEPVIEWMAKKGYSEKKVTYNEADGSFELA